MSKTVRPTRRPRSLLALVAAIVALVGLVGASLAGAQTDPGAVTPSTFSESANVPPPGSAGQAPPAAAPAPAATDQVQLSDLVKLGLLLMEPKGAAGRIGGEYNSYRYACHRGWNADADPTLIMLPFPRSCIPDSTR